MMGLTADQLFTTLGCVFYEASSKRKWKRTHLGSLGDIVTSKAFTAIKRQNISQMTRRRFQAIYEHIHLLVSEIGQFSVYHLRTQDDHVHRSSWCFWRINRRKTSIRILHCPQSTLIHSFSPLRTPIYLEIYFISEVTDADPSLGWNIDFKDNCNF